jgi:hypothetical protein
MAHIGLGDSPPSPISRWYSVRHQAVGVFCPLRENPNGARQFAGTVGTAPHSEKMRANRTA